MATVKIFLVNDSNKTVTYRNGSGSGTLPPGGRREIAASTGTIFLFENDKDRKYHITEADHGRTFYYN